MKLCYKFNAIKKSTSCNNIIKCCTSKKKLNPLNPPPKRKLIMKEKLRLCLV